MVSGTGIVIVEEREREFVYRKKCESCGNAEWSTTTRSKPTKGSIMNDAFTCPKCKNRQNIQIFG